MMNYLFKIAYPSVYLRLINCTMLTANYIEKCVTERGKRLVE